MFQADILNVNKHQKMELNYYIKLKITIKKDKMNYMLCKNL